MNCTMCVAGKCLELPSEMCSRRLALARSAAITEIPFAYRGVWSYRDLPKEVQNKLPWDDLDALKKKLWERPRLIHLQGVEATELGIAILKKLMETNWTNQDWRRFRWVNTWRVLRINPSFDPDEEYGVLDEVNIALFSDIHLVENPDRLYAVLASRFTGGLLSMFTGHGGTVKGQLAEFLKQARKL